MEGRHSYQLIPIGTSVRNLQVLEDFSSDARDPYLLTTNQPQERKNMVNLWKCSSVTETKSKISWLNQIAPWNSEDDNDSDNERERKPDHSFMQTIKQISKYNPNRFVTGDSEGSLHLYQVEDEAFNYARTIGQDHDGAITCMDVDLHQGRVATGGEDGTIRVTHINNFTKPDDQQEWSVTIDAINFASPSTIIYSQGNNINMVDLRVHKFQPVHKLRVEGVPERRFWDIDSHQSSILSGDSLGCLSLWDTRTFQSGESISRPVFANDQFHTGNIWKVSFIPSCPNVAMSCSDDGQLLTWPLDKVPVHTKRWAELPFGIVDFDFFSNGNLAVTTNAEMIMILYGLSEMIEEARYNF
eukprot:TRINITY_DN953_c0_g1_i1.p1 TRINITY_DN953_c0_g1~~TRINITY_DN953_c0_g1_i1.p1  ORF type:complete len:363 (-),score=47.90 TRINITY_DN953_c0_g1_i1:537-1604(-)